jgi:DNA-binding IclR family transcriptional regulator
VGPVTAACGLLRMLAGEGRPLPAGELAQRTGMPKGTVLCHLATLADEGLVQAAGGGWQLGLGLALYWASSHSRLTAERERIGRDLERIRINNGE